MGYRASVIIPVYNASKTVIRCVESIVYGREKNIEVILVDDFSKDDSFNVCKELSSKYPNVVAIQNEKNHGVSHTRNNGLAHANGEYILFVDSDDWVSKNYAKDMLDIAEQNEEKLAICGFNFVNQLDNQRVKYIWDENKSEIFQLESKDLFDIVDKGLLQLVWNKVFKREIIEDNNIKFDETKSMGEDFQFVLDYIKAADIDKFLIINRPFYYYVRANSNSLMSNFGIKNYNDEIERYSFLWEITKDKNNTKQRYEKAIERMKNNLFYQTLHRKIDKKEKEQLLITVSEEDFNKYYSANKKIVAKERILEKLQIINNQKNRIKGLIARKKREKKIKKIRNSVKVKDITIISQNCIAGVLYHDLNQQFLSPTINMFFDAKDFLKFVLNLDKYINGNMIMEWDEEYPIGHIDDVTVKFMHYDSCTQAMEIWEKRKARIVRDKIFVISTDRDGFDEQLYEQWKNVKYPKILFTANRKFYDGRNSVLFEQYEKDECVSDLIPQREFYKDNRLVDLLNSSF